MRNSRRGPQGILVVDKEVGITSHDVVQRVRRIFRMRQVGHSGTLDPIASGVLVVLVGSATRVAQYLQENDKEYHLTLLLGIETDTQDVTGRTVSRIDPSHVTREALEAAVNRYRGGFLQTPPSYSAIKHNGQPLYKLARRGVAVTVDPRKVTVYQVKISGWEPPRASLEVVCSKGTYMRTLCHDIGKDLGVGGCMESLVRVRSGNFTLEDAVKLDSLPGDAAALRPLLQSPASGLPFARYELEDDMLAQILMGRTVLWPGREKDGMISVVSGRRLVALGEITRKNEKTVLIPKRILEPIEKTSQIKR
ncbi:MAG: tRNA pseudouridine(55) synthase TruB [Deltaproteobacteria bacterium]|nr:tRNA pseudouridine(55) synthase TruB [Deltaproteobacteria bacterium]